MTNGKQFPRALTYILIILGLIILALVFMPLKLAVNLSGLDDSRFSARDISGSIWSGHMEQVQVGSFLLGDLDAGLQLSPLFAGKIKMDLKRPTESGGEGLTATIGKHGKTLLVENATTKLNVGELLAPLPASIITLDNVSVAFGNGRCQSASGKVRLSLDANIPGLDLKQGLLGNARCDDGVLVLPLISGSGMEELTMKLEANGFYTARLVLNHKAPAWTLILPTLGFQKIPSGYAIKIAGQLGQQR